VPGIARPAAFAPAREAAALSVAALRSEAEFAELAGEWNALHDAAAAASAFNAWAWLYEWWRVYGAGRRLHILTARRDGALCGVLPLYVETQRTLGVPVRVARLLGSGGDTYPDDLGPFFSPECERETAEVLAAAALDSDAWDALSVEDLDSRQPFGELLEQAAAKRGLRPERVAAQRIVYIDLPSTWEGYLASISRNRRSKVRSQRKKIHQEVPTRFHVWSDASAIDAAFDAFTALHHKRWRAIGQESGSFRTAEYLAFHRAIMRSALLRGALRLYVLDVNGEPAAMLYALRFRKGVYVVQAAFDPDLARLRPGLVLFGHAIQHAIEEGNRVFDFLRGQHSYKEHLGGGERETETVTVAYRTSAGLAWSLRRRLRHRVLPALKARVRPLARAVGLAK